MLPLTDVRKSPFRQFAPPPDQFATKYQIPYHSERSNHNQSWNSERSLLDIPLLVWIVVFSLLGSVGAIALAGSLLLIPRDRREWFLPLLVSYATGSLLGAAFLGLIPRSLHRISPHRGLATVLLGIVVFIVLEQIIVFHHSHGEEADHQGNSGTLILIGDTFHNLVDGAIIAAGFLSSTQLGIAVSLSVIAHEIPHEVGDFAILLRSGFRTGRALLYNMLSGLAALLGAVLVYFFIAEIESVLPYIMAFAAASFIYIAIADLVPDLKKSAGWKEFLPQFLTMMAGIGTIALFHFHG